MVKIKKYLFWNILINLLRLLKLYLDLDMEITNIEGFKPKELVLKDEISKVFIYYWIKTKIKDLEEARLRVVDGGEEKPGKESKRNKRDWYSQFNLTIKKFKYIFTDLYK